ncbi:MAG: uncharacterized protein QOF51_1682, partial [Chloroflexota bacterium]|nr:uncharacterized protein [Chloroflexota bacterium]
MSIPAQLQSPSRHAQEIRGWAALRLVLVPVGVTLFALAMLRAHVTAGAWLSTFSTRFLGIFIEAVPFLLVGALVSGLLEVFVSSSFLGRVIPRNRYAATVLGAFFGFIFPVCECGVVPVTQRLYSKGLPMAAGVTFLLASPVLNPIVLLSTYAAFGFGPILVGRVVITALVAIATGLIFAFAAKPEEELRSAERGVPNEHNLGMRSAECELRNGHDPGVRNAERGARNGHESQMRSAECGPRNGHEPAGVPADSPESPHPGPLMSFDRLRMSGLRMSGLGVSGLGVSGLGVSGLGVSGLGVSGLGVSGLGQPSAALH